MDNESNQPASAPMPPEPTSWQSGPTPAELAQLSPAYRSARLMTRIGLGLVIASPLIALSPILIALVMVQIDCPNGANEGNCSWAALPWFLFFSIPFSVLLGSIGAVVMFMGLARKSKVAKNFTN